ncbi:Imm63 family immunity protein [Pseudodesulfovibrio sp. zrk46]|uniref:Imm63 family immunity protein n=1 Tax=Pseudodesulfovibrio sp. zrk46 TaxID=2725288 RepID=UPI001448BBB6|nr:Imm63 family immunity protein [Pseudodesulfovibrio sp. zrk46]QJB56886.1 hypothetical protein HFN16_10940 [Pseudodesulfovibrio sp. zrk46]
MKTIKELQNELLRIGQIINANEDYLRIGEGVDVIIDVKIHGDEYHYIVIERGNEQKRIITNSSFELMFLFISSAAFSLSSRYAANNKIPGQDFRRLMFQHYLELLRRIGPRWEKRGQQKIDEILKKYPYEDE